MTVLPIWVHDSTGLQIESWANIIKLFTAVGYECS
jgi:hypothetical protein